MRESAKSGLHLTPEAQNRLNEVIRNRELGDGELEPVVLQQLASYPEEVQKNVIERFVTTGLTSEVQNKTGWLVGILKRELKAYQEALRFQGLDPSVSKKLENALRTRRLRPEEFPSDIIAILTKCGLHEQQIVVDKFLQKHNTNASQSQSHAGKGAGRGGAATSGPAPPLVSTRSLLLDIIRAELGPQHLQGYHAAADPPTASTAFANRRDYFQQKDGARDAHRANLQKTLRLHEDVIQSLLNVGDQELYEKLTSLGNLPPNYLDADKIWSMLGETSVDEQLRVVREMISVHHDEQLDNNDMSRFMIEKRREDFRVAAERILISYGFEGFGGQSQSPPMKGKIAVSDDGVTKVDFSELALPSEAWRQEFSPVTKRKLKQFMRGKSPALILDFHDSQVGEKLGRYLLDFFTKHKPNIDVSLVTLNLTNTDLQTDLGWNNIASFLLTTPARELELTTSKISSLSLGILVHTMFDGDFPNYAPFYMLPDTATPTLAIALPNNTMIRFPSSNEPWVKQWLTAGQMLIENETLVQVQHTYQHLRMRGPNPSHWYDSPNWNPPIHPARVGTLYDRLRKQGYLPPKETEPKAHKGGYQGGYYYGDTRGYDYFDEYGYGAHPPRDMMRNGSRGRRAGSLPEVYDGMGAKGGSAPSQQYGMNPFEYLGPLGPPPGNRPASGAEFRREPYPLQAPPPAPASMQEPLPARKRAPVIVDVREIKDGASIPVTPRVKKGRNKIPKDYVPGSYHLPALNQT